MAMVNVFRLGPSERDQLTEIPGGNLRMADQQARHLRDHADRGEVGDGVERQLGIERRVDSVTGEAN